MKKTILLALAFIIMPIIVFSQDCKPYASVNDVARQLQTDQVHAPIGNGVIEVYTIQYGVFLNRPTVLPKGVQAYPIRMMHQGVEKDLWIAFWDSWYFRKEDAAVIVHALKEVGTCQPFIKKALIGL